MEKTRRAKFVARLALALAVLSVVTSMVVALGFFLGSGLHTYMVLAYLAVTVGTIDCLGLTVIVILGFEMMVLFLVEVVENVFRRLGSAIARAARMVASVATAPIRRLRSQKPEVEEKPEES
jgi:hypothetical protein